MGSVCSLYSGWNLHSIYALTKMRQWNRPSHRPLRDMTTISLRLLALIFCIYCSNTFNKVMLSMLWWHNINPFLLSTEKKIGKFSRKWGFRDFPPPTLPHQKLIFHRHTAIKTHTHSRECVFSVKPECEKWDQRWIDIHQKHPDEERIVGAHNIAQVCAQFKTWLNRHVGISETVILVTWNGKNCYLKWLWKITQAPRSRLSFPPQIQFFIDPYHVITSFKSYPLHKSKSKCEGYDLGSVWKCIKGQNFNEAHNNLIDVKAQTEILINKIFVEFINRSASNPFMWSVLRKRQQQNRQYYGGHLWETYPRGRFSQQSNWRNDTGPHHLLRQLLYFCADGKASIQKYRCTLVGTVVPINKTSRSDEDLPLVKLSNGARNKLRRGRFCEAYMMKNFPRSRKVCYMQCMTWKDKKQVMFLATNRVGFSQGLTVQQLVKGGESVKPFKSPVPMLITLDQWMALILMIKIALITQQVSALAGGTFGFFAGHWIGLFMLNTLLWHFLLSRVLESRNGRNTGGMSGPTCFPNLSWDISSQLWYRPWLGWSIGRET